MSIADPIADMLTRIRNSIMAGKETCSLPHSRLKTQIGEILKKEGYISDCRVEGEKQLKTIHLDLKYYGDRQPAIRGLKRVSKQGLRKFSTSKDMPYVLDGLGIAIITTSKGIMTDKQARNENVGGEVMAYVW